MNPHIPGVVDSRLSDEGANMSKTWLVLLVAGVVVVALFMLIAVAAFLFFPQIQQSDDAAEGPGLGLRSRSHERAAPGAMLTWTNSWHAVNRRLSLYSHWKRLPAARKLDGQRIEVAVMNNSTAEKQRVERLLALSAGWSFASWPTLATIRISSSKRWPIRREHRFARRTAHYQPGGCR